MKNPVLLAFVISLIMPAVAMAGQNSLTIYSYHKIGEETQPDSNITIKQFNDHIEEIISNNYNVISIPDAVNIIKSGHIFPNKTIAISFEGGNKSAFKNAFPILDKNNFPYSVFISTNYMDWKNPSSISWKELKKLKKNKLVTIGLHPASYEHLTNASEEKIKTQINKAISRYREETGEKAEYFSYPFGENSKTYKNIIKSAGFKAAFGQQSGIAHNGSDIMLLPRFTMTENYAGIERFRLTANAKPLIVTDITPDNNLIDDKIFSAGFTLNDKYKDYASNLSCFGSDIGKLDIDIIEKTRIEIRVNEEIPDNRFRINCTLPTKTEDRTTWYWFGMLFTTK